MRYLFAALMAVFLPSVANAQQSCGPWQQMRNQLWRIGEAPFVEASGKDGSLVEIWRSSQGETWTITITAHYRGRKILCMIGSGENIETVIWNLNKQEA